MATKDERQYTFERLDEDRAKAEKIPFNIEENKFVILSDVHKGDRQKGSDDFERNEAVYCCALDYYLKNDFTLILAGDIEEGWECDFEKTVYKYKDTAFEMEKKFAAKGRYYRIYGNHDGDWAIKENVDRFLKPMFGDITIHPAAFIGDRIFVVHGHQGDIHSDRGAKFSRSVVRHFWKPLQNIFKFMNNRAAENNRIREKRDQYLFEWAKDKKFLLIAGHTHRGMFESYSKTCQLARKKCELEDRLKMMSDVAERLLIKEAIQRLEETIQQSKEELSKHKTISRLEENPPPCYFNDGCCVHTNGITGIEIERAMIRLVKWELSDTVCSENEEGKIRPDNIISSERKIYQSADLKMILSKI